MPKKPQELNQPKLLIGEGNDEVEFFQALLEYLYIKDVQVEDYRGKNGLTRYLKTLSEPRTGFRDVISLGITRDADGYNTPVQHDSAARAFQSVQDALKSASLPVPLQPIEKAGDLLNVSVFILPDCNSPGMLEDLCLSSIEDTEELACVDGFMSCMQTAGRKAPNIAKAKLHAWLSMQEVSDFRIGLAAQQKVWDWEHPKFDKIKEFLRNL
jgi:hypothetical protein